MRTTRNEKQRYRTSKNARRKKILMRDSELPPAKVVTTLRQLYSRPIVQLEHMDNMNKKPERGTRYYNPNWYNFDDGKHRRRRWNDLDDIWKPNYDYDESDSWDTNAPNTSNNNQQQYRYNCNNPYLYPYQYYANGKQNSYIKRSTIFNYNGNVKQVKRLSPHKSNLPKEATSTSTSAEMQLNTTTNNNTVTSSTEQNPSVAPGNSSNEGSNINNDIDFSKKRFNINKKLSYLENYSKPSSGKIETTKPLPETQTVVGENIQSAKKNNLLNKSAEKSSENKTNKSGVKESPKMPANNAKVGNKSNCTLDAYIQNILPTTLNKKTKEDAGKVNPSEKPNVINTTEIVNNILKNYKIPKDKNSGKTTANNTVATVSCATTIANSSGTSENKNVASSPKNYSPKNRTNIVTYQNTSKRPKIAHDTGSLKLNNNNIGSITNNNVFNNQLLRNCLNLNDFKSASRKTTIILSKPTETPKVAETSQPLKENTTCEDNKVIDKAGSSENKEDIKQPTAKITNRRNTVAQSSVSDAALKEDTAENRDESASKLDNKLTTEETTNWRAKIRNRRQTFAYLPEPVLEMAEDTTKESEESSAEATLNSAPDETANTRSKIRKRRQTIADPIVPECNSKKENDKDENDSVDQCGKEDPIISSKGKCEKRRKIEPEIDSTEVSTNEATESEDPPECDLLGSNTNTIKTPIQKFDNYELHSGYTPQQPSTSNDESTNTNNASNTKQIPLSCQSSILDPRLKNRPNLQSKLIINLDANEGSPNKSIHSFISQESLHFLFDEIYDAPEKRSSISSQPAIPWNLKKIVGSNYVVVHQASSSNESTQFETVSTLETITHTSLVQNADERTQESVLKTSTCTNTATAVNDQSKIYQHQLNRFLQLNSRNLRSILEECRGPTPAPNVAEPILNQHSANNSNAPPETNHNNSTQSLNNVNQSTIKPATTSSHGTAIATQTEPKRTRSKSKAKSKTVDKGGEAQSSMTQVSYETFVSDFYYQIFVYCDTQMSIAQKFKSLVNAGVPSEMVFQELQDFDVTFHNKVRRFAELVRSYFQTRFIVSFNCKCLFRCFCLIDYNRSRSYSALPFLLRLFYGVTVEIKKLGKVKGFLEVFCKDIENVYRCNISNHTTNLNNIATSQNQQQMNQPHHYQAQNNEQHYQNSPSQCYQNGPSQCLQNNQSCVQYQNPPPPYPAPTYCQSSVVQPHSGFETQTLTQPHAFSQSPALSQPQAASKFQTYSQPYTVSQAHTVSQPPHQYERMAQQQNLGQFRQPQQKQLGTSEGNDVYKLSADQESMFQLQCSVYNSLIRNFEMVFVQRTGTTLNQPETNELQSQNNILSTSHLPNPNVLPNNDSVSDVTQPTINYKIRLPLSQPLTATASINTDVDVRAGDHLASSLQSKASPIATLDDNLNCGQDTEVQTRIDVKNVLDYVEPIDVEEWFRLKMLSADVIDLDDFFFDDHNIFIKSENENNGTTDSNAVDVIPRFGSVDSGLASSPNEIEHPDVLNGERLCLCSNKAELVCLCGKAIYCSTKCQRADWYTHKLECSRSRGLIS